MGPLPELQVPRSQSYYRSAFKDNLYDEWKKEWKSDHAFARQTKLWFSEPSFRKTRRMLAQDRVSFSRTVRWITGHAFLQVQNQRAGQEVDPECRLCGQSPEKADHILRECPALGPLREECFGFHLWRDGQEWEMGGLIKFLSDDRVLRLEDSEDGSMDDGGGYISDDMEAR